MTARKQPSDGIPMAVVQWICIIALIALVVIDKIKGWIIPPLHDFYYAALFGVGVFGKGFKDFFKK